MKANSLVGRCVAVILLALLTGCDPGGADREAIQMAWQSYHEATATRNGNQMLATLTDGTFAQYERLIKIALTGNRDTFDKLRAVERAEVFGMRHLSTKAELEKLNGRGYVSVAVTRGWWTDEADAAARMRLRQIVITEGTATADLEYRGELSGYKLRFEQQDGVWKFDETSIIPFLDGLIDQAATRMGVRENELLLRRLADRSGKGTSEWIWEPLSVNRPR